MGCSSSSSGANPSQVEPFDGGPNWELWKGLAPPPYQVGDTPLVTGYGLAATEKGFPGAVFNETLKRASELAGAGGGRLVVQPHAGEEWSADGEVIIGSGTWRKGAGGAGSLC